MNTIGQPELASWYSLYLAAIAIDAICVRQGFSGMVSRLGESSHMTRPMTMIRANPSLGGSGDLVVTVGDRNFRANMTATS